MADAEAICEAVTRPTMRFVPIKTTDQQALLVLHGVRDKWVRFSSRLINIARSIGGVWRGGSQGPNGRGSDTGDSAG